MKQRVESIDLLRGVVMILMALDHVRDYFGVVGINPTDPAKTTVALFFTRWITHICAPTFFLLTGTGAFRLGRKLDRPALSRYLATRGVWLLFLEVVVVRCLGFQFNFDYRVTMLVVIWALGWAMIVLAGLVRLPLRWIVVFGVVMIAGHNLLDGVRLANPIWAILHGPGMVVMTERFVVFAAYPLIPWLGVTALGYALGQVYDWPATRRQEFLIRTGAAMVLAFLILRGINVYGDPSRWSPQASPMGTVLSFLNATKYPPSLLFLLMTLGPSFLLLGVLDAWTPRSLGPALTFGRVPLYYFLVHLTAIHALAVVAARIRYGTAHWLFESPDLGNYPFTQPPGWGYPLPVVYLVWVGLVAALYPLCRWFAGVKARRTEWWLSYL